MNNRIFIITVFISNIAFAGVLPQTNIQETVNTKSNNKLSTQVSTQLFKRGLDKKIAIAKVKHTLAEDEAFGDLMVQNILKNIPSMKESDIINFITQATLQEKRVDLSSYETLVALVQRYSNATFDKELLLHVEKATHANEKLKSMQGFL